jgi:hypothetical protein
MLTQTNIINLFQFIFEAQNWTQEIITNQILNIETVLLLDTMALAPLGRLASRPGPARKGKAMKFLHATLLLCFIHSEEKKHNTLYLARPCTYISTAFCFSPYQEIEARGIENYSSSLLILISHQKTFKK